MCDESDPEPGECRCKVERTPNFAQPRLLLELAKKASHGYELIERLSEGGDPPPDPGNFYRMLRALEEDGYVNSAWDTENSGPARRVYRLTDQGKEFLNVWAVIIRQTQSSLNRFLSEYESISIE